MQEGNLVCFQNIIETRNNETIEIFIAEIIKITEKAVLIEWDDSTFAFLRKCKAWVPKSKLILMDSKLITWKKHRHRLFYVALPEWVKLEVEIIRELDYNYPERYYEDKDIDDIFTDNYNSSIGYISPEDSLLDGYYDGSQEMDDDMEGKYLIEEYNKNIKPWIPLWDKTIICRRCYRGLKVECKKSKCPNHPDNPDREIDSEVGLSHKKKTK